MRFESFPCCGLTETFTTPKALVQLPSQDLYTKTLVDCPAGTVRVNHSAGALLDWWNSSRHATASAFLMTPSQRYPITLTCFLFQLKSGRTSAPRLPQTLQVNRPSMSDSRIWSDHRSALIPTECIHPLQAGSRFVTRGVTPRGVSRHRFGRKSI